MNYNQKLVTNLNEFDVVPLAVFAPDSTITPNLTASGDPLPLPIDISGFAPAEPVDEFTPKPNIAQIVANVYSEMSGTNTVQPTTATPPINNLNTSVKDLATNVGAALGNAGGTILGNLLNGAVQGASNGVKDSVANTTSTIASLTLKQWFKKNWYYVTGGIIVFFLGVWYFVKTGKKSAIKSTLKRK